MAAAPDRLACQCRARLPWQHSVCCTANSLRRLTGSPANVGHCQPAPPMRCGNDAAPDGLARPLPSPQTIFFWTLIARNISRFFDRNNVDVPQRISVSESAGSMGSFLAAQPAGASPTAANPVPEGVGAAAASQASLVLPCLQDDASADGWRARARARLLTDGQAPARSQSRRRQSGSSAALVKEAESGAAERPGTGLSQEQEEQVWGDAAVWHAILPSTNAVLPPPRPLPPLACCCCCCCEPAAAAATSLLLLLLLLACCCCC